MHRRLATDPLAVLTILTALVCAHAGCGGARDARRGSDPLANTRLIRPADATRAREGGGVATQPERGAAVMMPPGLWRAATQMCAQTSGDVDSLMDCLCSDKLWQSAGLPPDVLFLMEWPIGPVGMTDAGPVPLGPVFRLSVTSRGVESCGLDTPSGQPLRPYTP